MTVDCKTVKFRQKAAQFFQVCLLVQEIIIWDKD